MSGLILTSRNIHNTWPILAIVLKLFGYLESAHAFQALFPYFNILFGQAPMGPIMSALSPASCKPI